MAQHSSFVTGRTRRHVQQSSGSRRKSSIAVLSTERADIASMKHALLAKVAGLDRGKIASYDDRADVSILAEQLATARPFQFSEGASGGGLNGRWQLIYASAEVFRSSPFFWAFQEGLVQDRNIAAAIFAFTDSIPGADIGIAYQTIDVEARSLVSEVDLLVFPSIKGTVVTTSSVEVQAPNRMVVTVQNTRISNSNFFQFTEAVTVPVQDIIERLRGAGSTNVQADVCYLDDSMRIVLTRPDNQLFIYKRA